MYKYTHFIPQNIAPKGTKQIGVYDSNGNKVCAIPLGRMTPPSGDPLYSFLLVSDIHLWYTERDYKPNAKFDNALTYAENKRCAFCVVSGDLTQTGFYLRTVETDASTTYFDEGQLAKYKEICDKHLDLPVYELAGNHESYYSMPLSDNLTKWGEYTGKEVLHYTVEHENDVFIFCGQPSGSIPMTDEAFAFLSNTLSANSNKRCFIFIHPQFTNDSGNALGAYESNQYLDSWKKATDFKNLLNEYKNAILFHGHSHLMFECQEFDECANYTEKNGFRSVHIPSLSRPRYITMEYAPSDSQGYIVDVYDDCIVLNGIDFINNECVPLGTYKIDTTLQTIEENTFTDSTGTITT